MTDRTKLDDATIDERLASLDGWQRDGDAIVRELQFDDFNASFGFLTSGGRGGPTPGGQIRTRALIRASAATATLPA